MKLHSFWHMIIHTPAHFTQLFPLIQINNDIGFLLSLQVLLIILIKPDALLFLVFRKDLICLRLVYSVFFPLIQLFLHKAIVSRKYCKGKHLVSYIKSSSKEYPDASNAWIVKNPCLHNSYYPMNLHSHAVQ